MTRGSRVRPFVSARPTLSACLLAATVLVAPGSAAAQASAAPWEAGQVDQSAPDWSDDVPAHVSFAEGEAWLDREGTVDGAPTGVPLLAGDRVRTRSGRLEILFADGSVLSLDQDTDAELLSDTLLRLDRGRIRLDLTRTAGAAGYRVDAGGTTTWIRSAGEYRLELDHRSATASDVRLLVVRGQAELSANGGRTHVRAGYEAFGSSDTTPSLPYAVTVTRWDTFDRWWDDRRATRSGFASAQYLPSEISYYSGVLDRDGDWQYEPTYGYVWYPRVVDGWQPYSTGRWTYVGAYGWTWVGSDHWAWPTHHYGRWGYSGRRYYWIPGRQWAPAWVSWAASPGYVGWVPLGYDNRPLISVHIGYSSGWRGWTHVPARSFSAGIVISQRGRYLPPRGLQFNDGYRGPGRPSTLVVRQTPGLRGPGGAVRGSVAVPRVSTQRSQPLGAGGPVTRSTGGPYRTVPSGDQRVVPTMPRRESPAASAPSSSSSPLRSRTSPQPRLPSNSTAPSVVSPRAPQRSAPGAAAPGSVGGARPRGSVTGQPAQIPERMSRPQPRTPSGGVAPSRGPLMRSRAPESVGAPVPSPRVGAERSRPAAAPADEGAPVDRSRGVPSMPSRQRSETMRLPQPSPRVESPRPSREAPAARQAPVRQAPAARQAPAESPRGRAVARPRSQ
jgi:hypothetical protein